MKSVSINRKVSLTRTEKDAIVRSLVSKGIDEKLVRGALASVSDDCPDYGCPKFVVDRVNPDALSKLKREMDAKGIKLTNVDPAVAKLFK